MSGPVDPQRATADEEREALARRLSGRALTPAEAWLWLGALERARAIAEAALADSDLHEDGLARALALSALARLDSEEGLLDRGLSRAQEARAIFERAGRIEEAIATALDSAEVLLRRDGPADLSAAAAELAAARAALAALAPEARPAALEIRLRILLAWARGATGGGAGATDELESLRGPASSLAWRDLRWQLDAALARVLALSASSESAAVRAYGRALEALEDLAAALPRDARATFFTPAWRAEVRAGAKPLAPATADVARAPGASPSDPAVRDGRWAHLVEITNRLATEHDLTRLLERITESAVELCGAERGFVLLVEGGQLRPAAVRDASAPDDPHVAFSRSIAEAVLIDGEPIVTVDARNDRRLNEYLSVHQLMLQSVACIPIRAPGAAGPSTVGVLYVEHRVRKGRFGSSDLELLLAFADTAAIAITNARLIAENEARRRALETANEALEVAKDEIERLLHARTQELDETRAELGRAREALRSSRGRHGIVGRSEAMQRVLSIIDRVKDASVPVVIQGESGTGKELAARAIHDSGSRANGPFIAINCASIPEQLLESELFGHVRGAFTGADKDRTGVLAQASGGTLFLDEIGDMPPKMQVDLLRVISDGRVRPLGSESELAVDVRIVCASNKSLEDLVARGQFREDLYYRLNVVALKLPPLRERREDIALLCEHFLQQIARREGGAYKRISRDAVRRLMREPLPGNVRQLEHLLMNAWVMVSGDTIEENDLALGDRDLLEGDSFDEPEALDAQPPTAGNLDEWKAQERRRILEALEATIWNRVRAAEQLGMPRRTFYRRLKEYSIL